MKLDKSKQADDKTEKLARLLWEVHAHMLVPFYYESYESFHKNDQWEYLVEKTKIKTDVDKDFFRRMSKFIQKELNEERLL